MIINAFARGWCRTCGFCFAMEVAAISIQLKAIRDRVKKIDVKEIRLQTNKRLALVRGQIVRSKDVVVAGKDAVKNGYRNRRRMRVAPSMT